MNKCYYKEKIIETLNYPKSHKPAYLVYFKDTGYVNKFKDGYWYLMMSMSENFLSISDSRYEQITEDGLLLFAQIEDNGNNLEAFYKEPGHAV